MVCKWLCFALKHAVFQLRSFITCTLHQILLRGRLRWVGHAHKIWVGKHEAKRPDERPMCRWEIILEFSSPPRPEWLWGPPYPMGTRGFFPGDKATCRRVKLTTHLHLVPRSRMDEVIPPLPQYAFKVWCSVKI